MSEANTVFCRLYLKIVMEDVRKHVPKEDIKKSWGWSDRCGGFEFHGPDGFYWYGSASNMNEAKASGWMAYLTKIGAPGYELSL